MYDLTLGKHVDTIFSGKGFSVIVDVGMFCYSEIQYDKQVLQISAFAFS
jgi:hypothetical protein